MDQTHIHLLITHLPIFGSILGGVVLLYGIWKKSNHTIIAAYLLFVISSIGAGIGYLTGEAAEETVENIAGISKDIVERHEEFAVVSLVALIALGLASVIGLLVPRKSRFTGTIAVVVLFMALISFGLVARTGYLGGQIRHTEISPASTSMPQGGENEDDD